jgi:hypothetical protein
MKLELIELVENEDGSADLQLDVDDEAKKILLQLGLETMLWDVIHKIEKESKC